MTCSKYHITAIITIISAHGNSEDGNIVSDGGETFLQKVTFEWTGTIGMVGTVSMSRETIIGNGDRRSPGTMPK